jgi:hypothetical protein
MPCRPKMRDRALAVTCPTCGAPPAESCGPNAQGKPDVHPQRITLADRTVFSRGGETGQDEPASLGRLRGPSRGAARVSDPVRAPLHCTRCEDGEK